MDWLLIQLDNSEPGVVYEALRALTRAGHPGLAPRVEKFLVHQDLGIVRAAARCLRRWRRTEAVLPLLYSDCPKRRACGAANLSDGELLALALEGEEKVSVQLALISSLARCAYVPAGALVRKLARTSPKLLRVALEYLKRTGLEPLDRDLLLLAMRDESSQPLAACLLWRLGLGDYRQALVDLVRSRHHAVVSVLMAGGQECLELLLEVWAEHPELVDGNLWGWRQVYASGLRRACQAKPQEGAALRKVLRGLVRDAESGKKARQMLRGLA